jgi:hypothetical protein
MGGKRTLGWLDEIGLKHLLAPPRNAVLGCPQLCMATRPHLIGDRFRFLIVGSLERTLLFDPHEYVDKEETIPSHARP